MDKKEYVGQKSMYMWKDIFGVLCKHGGFKIWWYEELEQELGEGINNEIIEIIQKGIKDEQRH